MEYDQPNFEPQSSPEREDKAVINNLLSSIYDPEEIERWWTLPLRMLGGQTPEEAWKNNSDQVRTIAEAIFSPIERDQ